VEKKPRAELPDAGHNGTHQDYPGLLTNKKWINCITKSPDMPWLCSREILWHLIALSCYMLLSLKTSWCSKSHCKKTQASRYECGRCGEMHQRKSHGFAAQISVMSDAGMRIAAAKT
jgi:hypothetical protein